MGRFLSVRLLLPALALWLATGLTDATATTSHTAERLLPGVYTLGWSALKRGCSLSGAPGLGARFSHRSCKWDRIPLGGWQRGSSAAGAATAAAATCLASVTTRMLG